MSYTIAYNIVTNFYEGKSAERSGIPYMNHIDEGIVIMKELGASDDAIGGYCLHPLVQSQLDFMDRITEEDSILDGAPPKQLLLAVEYRHTANSFLSPKTNNITRAEVLELHSKVHNNEALKHMLVADKIQNQKDFLLYHYGIHENSDTLDTYFKMWLNDILEVDQRLRELIA